MDEVEEVLLLETERMIAFREYQWYLEERYGASPIEKVLPHIEMMEQSQRELSRLTQLPQEAFGKTEDYEDWIKKELTMDNVDFGLGAGRVIITVHKDKLPEDE